MDEQWNLVDQVIFVLADFLVALRGEEVFKLVLGIVRAYFKEAIGNSRLLRVVLLLEEIFKEETRENFHCVLVTA